MTSIRRAAAADLNPLVELWLALGAEGRRADARYRLRADALITGRTMLADRLLADGSLVVVADTGGALAGCMSAVAAETHPVLEGPATLRITDAYVAPTHRRRGVGRRLFEAVERFARDGGFAALEVGTLALDDRAVAFWASLGFGEWRVSLQRPVDPAPSAARGRPVHRSRVSAESGERGVEEAEEAVDVAPLGARHRTGEQVPADPGIE